jgi:hypothetical protein
MRLCVKSWMKVLSKTPMHETSGSWPPMPLEIARLAKEGQAETALK